jgi:hypothetical protein
MADFSEAVSEVFLALVRLVSRRGGGGFGSVEPFVDFGGIKPGNEGVGTEDLKFVAERRVGSD